MNGKGFMIWKATDPEMVAPAALATLAATAGFRHLEIKIADGPAGYNLAYLRELVSACHALGVEVWGWQYVYGVFPAQEAERAKYIMAEYKLDGFLIDAEVEYKLAGAGAAKFYMARLRDGWNGKPIALCTYRFPTLHPEFPWDAFADQADFFAPQMYWVEAHNPADQLARCLKEYRARWPGKKIAPVGAAYQENGWRATPGEIKEFAEAVQKEGLSGYSFWEWSNAIRYGLWDTVAGLEVETGEDSEAAPTSATVRTAALNFRSAPVVDSKNVITGLPRGTEVELLNLVTDAAGNIWAQVNLSGWVAVKYRGSTLAELS
ncbi:MAG TPA: SH3 domain-containing protein [Bellilinea sp.]|nr:SH3 domain-containing protein [Bellilinea sp.]